MLDFLKKSKKEKELQAAREAERKRKKKRDRSWQNRKQKLPDMPKAVRRYAVL